MSEQLEAQVDTPTEAEELAAALAGYNHETRGEQPPVEVAETEAEEEVVETAPEPAGPSVADLASELQALKAKVAASSNEPDVVRRMHGEIGNINRTLKQLQATPQAAPVNDELAAALSKAEEVADDFGEVAAPLLNLIKAQMKAQQQPEPLDDSRLNELLVAKVTELRQKEALEALAEEHPDYEEVKNSDEFNTWLTAKPPEYQQKLLNSWNPMVVSRGLSEFKESIKARERKQNRLANAVVAPTGSQPAKPSTISDEEALLIGYNKGPKRLNSR